MLRELHIQNLAVIEDARVELSDGLNCFTGMTGAGKSLVIGAFEVLLGLRSAGDLLREGADEGRVTGLFDLSDSVVAEHVRSALDLPAEADGDSDLLLTRKLFASGRSGYTANGQPVTAAMARLAGELLVDIHGQHDHQHLLKPSNQLLLIDAFGESADQREGFGEVFREMNDLRKRRDELEASRALRVQQLDLYRFQAEEIDAAALVAGEYDVHRARHTRMSNAARLRREAEQVTSALADSEGNLLERLHALTQVMLTLTELDDGLNDVTEQVRTATLTLQDASFELGRYVDRVDCDPGELDRVEDRLNTLNRLIAKFADASHVAAAAEFLDEDDEDDAVSRVLAYRDWLQQQIDQLVGDDDSVAHLSSRIEELEEELSDIGHRLSAARRDAAESITPAVEAELRDLGMAEATLVAQVETDEGAATATGFDRVELLVRANPGQPARPLRKVASGGELSRIMLAIKSVFADAGRISVLVFDEIDANIGGRMGTTIGQKLRALSRRGGAKQQVLCITHLPQIAAFADRHLHIKKQVTGKGKSKQTRTTVEHLSGAPRIAELAEMLAGQEVSATTRKQAKEMLEAAGV